MYIDKPFTYRPRQVGAKLYLIIIVFLFIGLFQFFASRIQADILSAVRAYVEGEALWSKAQKDGMLNLLRYASSHNIDYYHAFQDNLVVQMGDKQARLELEKPYPDFQRVYEGFIAGGNHPDDVEGMAWLVYNFHAVPYLAKAVDIWSKADEEIVNLRHIANRLHDEIQNGSDSVAKSSLINELEQSNQRLTLFEQEFSSTLGEAARWVTWMSTALNLFFTTLVLSIGTLMAWHLVHSARKAEQGLANSEAQFRRLADSNIIGAGFWHIDGYVLDANDAFLQMMGFSRQDLAEKRVNWRAFTPPEHHDKADKALAEMAAKGSCSPFETEWIRSDGSYVPVLVGAALLDGRPERGVAFTQDLSERRRNEEELRLSAKVLEQSSEALIITNASNKIIRVNRAFSEITGYSSEEVVGKKPNILKSGRHSPAFYRDIWKHLNTYGYWCGEIWDRRKSGDIYPKWLNINAIKNVKGEVSHYAAIFSDITAQKEYQARLEHIAHFDALTGLPNRMLLSDRLGQAMTQAQRYGERLAVIYLDLDGFKEINDSYGHDVGDRLLVALAKRMKHTLRGSDTLARLGGDEFVGVVSHLTNEKACVPRLNRLLAVAAQPVHIGVHVLQVSASLGVSFYPQPEEIGADILLRQADQAMYQAKLTGKNRYHIFDAEHDRSLRGHHESLDRIQHALHEGEFVLYYQPKVNMRSGEFVGVEALIRWQHPERGIISPEAFLPVIEGHPLTLELDEWVIDSALRQIEIWHEVGHNITVSVNVSALCLQQVDFTKRLNTLLEAHPSVNTNDLILEVLETSALEDIEHISQVIRTCADIGIEFALDDFGTGYSSLTYLKRLPANQLKIDRSFVSNMLNDSEDLAIVEGVLGLARTFRRLAIAEGVETQAHCEILLRLGCEYAQGYGIAKPMPAHELPTWANHWRPEPSWAGVNAIRHDDLPLLFASVEHRGWFKSFKEYITGERDAPVLPDTQIQCLFGRWLEGEAQSRYTAGAVLKSITHLHQQVHTTSRELIKLRETGRTAQVQGRLEELQRLQNLLLVKVDGLLSEASLNERIGPLTESVVSR